MNKLDELEKLAKDARSNPASFAYLAAVTPHEVLKLIAVARAASMPSITWPHWESPHLNNDEAYQLKLELEDLQIALKQLLGERT